MKINPKKALDLLAAEDGPFKTVFEHGSLSVEVYQPEKVDLQQLHEQDEVYVIISGKGEFLNGDERMSFNAGDFLFVPAGVEHWFENFSDDFSTWVIFYGPKGEKKPSQIDGNRLWTCYPFNRRYVH